MMAQGVTARRTQYDRITASHASRWYGSGHGIASWYCHSSGHHAAAVVMMMVQMFGLATTTTTTAMHVTIGRHCEMHFFHGRPFGFGRFADAIAICEFYVIEQGLEPL